jgi:hypothetical protein
MTHPINNPGPTTPQVQVEMDRAQVPATADQSLWVAIRNSTDALGFENYATFIEPIMCAGKLPASSPARYSQVDQRVQLTFPDAEPYRLLRVATEVFMMANCGVVVGGPRSPNALPALAQQTLTGATPDFGALLTDPNLEEQELLRLLRSTNATPTVQAQWTEYIQQYTDRNGRSVTTLPYLYDIVALKLGDLPLAPDNASGARLCYGVLQEKLSQPCFIELIWNYWLEEGMLVQTMNALSWRFQNRRGPQDRDPLAMVEIDPLRRLNNLLWGWVSDEEHRLTIPRRAYEYDHEYGLKLLGKAVPAIDGADSRSRFLEGFHTLLMLCTIFYKEDDDTTVVADGFPVLNALREVHLQLTQGAHNQYGDLPWTARQEFLMQEWILARPEMREFLPRRIMVDYPEAWMDSVETMKTLQGWTETSILHFRDMSNYGEKILLAVRYGAWTDEIYPENAANWARYWRPEIQGYIFAYRAATGVDLAATTVTGQVNATAPSVLLQQRLPQRAPAGGTRPAVRATGAQPRALPDRSQRRALPSGSSRSQRRADRARQRSQASGSEQLPRS